jgi:AAA family ATP:ADP antiporter
MLAAPASSYLLSYPHLPKGRALVLLYRFFGGSLIFFFLLYVMVPAPALSVATKDFSWIFTVVRASFFLWIALLNLFTISAMWARVTDIMSSEVWPPTMKTFIYWLFSRGFTFSTILVSLSNYTLGSNELVM